MSFRLIHGKVEQVLPTLEQNSFDACLCDPPYALTANKRGGSGLASVNLESPYGRARIGTGNGGGFMGKGWDAELPGREVWLEVLRVLKPGAMLLAFGGTRTHHRLMCAIEDAGFEIRDCLMWLYGSGFPKSMDISKAIDKAAGMEREVVGRQTDGRYAYQFNGTANRPTGGSAGSLDAARIGGFVSDKSAITAPVTDVAKLWDGYGTALKPAWEPIILAMKPCEGTFAQNALKWGVAGLAIDAGRISVDGSRPARSNAESRSGLSGTGGASTYGSYAVRGSIAIGETEQGRWPANVLLNEESAVMLDQQTGELTSGANPERRGSDKFRGTYHAFEGQRECNPARGADSGGASRFYYIAKADSNERHAAGKNPHPTVKPVDLAAYLSKLLLPPAGRTRRMVVPFAGSGSEIIGALRAGWDEVVGIEMEAEYLEVARKRIATDSPLFNLEASL